LATGQECDEDYQCQLPSAFCDPANLLCATGFAVTPAAEFCQPYLRVRPDAGPMPDARVRAEAADRPAADADGPVDSPEDGFDGAADVPDAADADPDQGD
jgi:hypothetical protein